MRLRKKSWSPEVFKTHADTCFSGDSSRQGLWKQTLDTDRLHLEIGSGKGDYWHQMADLFPEEGFVALERDMTASAIALKKLPHYQSQRKQLIVGDASSLSDIFAAGEVDVIHLNFSDPWPKKRHEKRRLTHASKCRIYSHILNEGGLLILKTDNRQLFNYSLVSVTGNGFELVDVDVDFRQEVQDDPFTEYERKFHELGQPIYHSVWRKQDVR